MSASFRLQGALEGVDFALHFALTGGHEEDVAEEGCPCDGIDGEEPREFGLAARLLGKGVGGGDGGRGQGNYDG